MAGPPRSTDSAPDTGEDTGAAADRGSPPRVPRWVKVSAIVVVTVAVLLVALMFLGGHRGQPGPGKHGPAGIEQPR